MLRNSNLPSKHLPLKSNAPEGGLVSAWSHCTPQAVLSSASHQNGDPDRSLCLCPSLADVTKIHAGNATLGENRETRWPLGCARGELPAQRFLARNPDMNKPSLGMDHRPLDCLHSTRCRLQGRRLLSHGSLLALRRHLLHRL